MSRPSLPTGTVISYPYLWLREQKSGETEGRKPRPVAVALNTGKHIVLLPITSKVPGKGRNAIEIPDTEKRNAGLDAFVRLWIMLDEINLDDPLDSYYLGPKSILGAFSKPFFSRVLAKLKRNLGTVRQVVRR